ncbi:hypothetical protein E2C01_056776 [Portunus trituberculatus]|uniref:Uncharacterized protein n=1 Tax=Portunus trituberculatus TaxID=210409 RepID=A0A5B7H028_PORTR|nr:hypothetical protein [Portunus trituberculatus]
MSNQLRGGAAKWEPGIEASTQDGFLGAVPICVTSNHLGGGAVKGKPGMEESGRNVYIKKVPQNPPEKIVSSRNELLV